MASPCYCVFVFRQQVVMYLSGWIEYHRPRSLRYKHPGLSIIFLALSLWHRQQTFHTKVGLHYVSQLTISRRTKLCGLKLSSLPMVALFPQGRSLQTSKHMSSVSLLPSACYVRCIELECCSRKDSLNTNAVYLASPTSVSSTLFSLYVGFQLGE